MLVELAVTNLGVIAEARIPFGAGLTALTGETGAGKTMVVEALHLLTGGRPDPSRVRVGESEAVVEGLFAVGDDEWALRRVVPAEGRSRAYVNGSLSTAAELAALGDALLELHGQHGQQALLQPRHQRDALDQFAGIDRDELRDARRRVTHARRRLDELGGDERARAREVDLLSYQIDEIDALAPQVGEETALDVEEDLLAGALEHRAAGDSAAAELGDDGAAADLVARALARLAGRLPFESVVARLSSIQAELVDCVADVRATAESIEPDEERLAEVRGRRQALADLRRKYGATIEEVLEFAADARRRLTELTSHDAAVAAAEAELAAASVELRRIGEAVGDRRRSAAGPLADAVRDGLAELALGGSEVEIDVADTEEMPLAGESVEVRLSTNAGSPPGPLARVASGGELSRVMLALRVVLSGGPPTMVFDEIDAGVGGEAATAVGRSLARIAQDHQVLVVTHLPQVAAFADHQVVVTKRTVAGVTVTDAQALDDDDRVIELSRMLSGSPGSATAREHAHELLVAAAGRRGRSVSP